jgi:hypothetical protein
MEVKMTFRLPDDAEDLRHCQSGYDYYLALTHIADDIFRPNRKHGYDGPLKDMVGDKEVDIIVALEEMFYEILTRYGISLT